MHDQIADTSAEGGVSVVTRRDALKKAAVGGAILWAAPVITSLPASAATPSGCVPVDVDFGVPGSVFSATTIAGVGISRGTAMDGGSSPMGDNLTVVQNQGGLSGSFIKLNQTAVENGGQTLTLNFSQPVTNVSFAITDIDNQSHPGDGDGSTLVGWSDRVTINTGGYTYTTAGSVVGVGQPGNGSGTQSPDSGGDNFATGAFRNTATDNVGDTSSAGNVFLTFAGPLTSLSLRFWCGERDGIVEQINIGALTFTPCD